MSLDLNRDDATIKRFKTVNKIFEDDRSLGLVAESSTFVYMNTLNPNSMIVTQTKRFVASDFARDHGVL